MEILKGTAQKLLPFISSKATPEHHRCHLRSDRMRTDAPTFLLLLCALSSYSDGLCVKTTEYKRNIKGLGDAVKVGKRSLIAW